MSDKYTESLYKQNYSDWISDQRLPSHGAYYLTGEDLEFVFDAQQSKIKELLERLKECEESLVKCGSKHARAYFKKYEDKK